MRPAFKFVAFAIAAVALMACGHIEHPPVITSGVPDVVVPRPAAVALQQPQIMVVNQANLQQFDALVGSGTIVIAMTQAEFNKLVENNQQVMVYMSNQNTVIDTYEGRITHPTENHQN